MHTLKYRYSARTIAARSRVAAAACGLLAFTTGAVHADVTHKLKRHAAPSAHSAAKSAAVGSKSFLLAYNLTPGATHHYKVTAIFNGHIPPFAQPGSPPANLKILLDYTANVKKQDADGTVVDFAVNSADLILLEKEPGPDGKSDPSTEAPFPLPLSQVQDMFNVTATLRPDGSVTNVTGGKPSNFKIDLGIDLRKLFLLLLPVQFADKPVKINEPWSFTDGLLGQKPGKITYESRLTGIGPKAGKLVFDIAQTAQSTIEDRRDKDGKPTTTEADVVDSTTGKATLTGSLKFVSPASTKAGARPSLLSESNLVMIAIVNRKRTKPDPEHPDDPLETAIDVKARFLVRADDSAKPKSADAAKSAQLDKNAASRGK